MAIFERFIEKIKLD